MINNVYFQLDGSDEWQDSAALNLFVTKWDFPDPTVKKMTVSIPGLSGDIDLSSALTGDVAFENVKGTVSFAIFRDFDLSAFRDTYHGKIIKLRNDTDPDYYRIGRAEITSDNRLDKLRQFTISVNADPFAYSLVEKTYTLPVKAEEELFLTATFQTGGNYTSYSPIKSAWTSSPTRSFKITNSNVNNATFDLPYITLDANTLYIFNANRTITLTTNNGGKVRDRTYVVFAKSDGTTKTASTGEIVNSEDYETAYIHAYAGFGAAGNRGYITVSDIYYHKLGQPADSQIINNGRKIVVPTITSEIDATAITPSGNVTLTAGKPQKLFGVDLKQGANGLAIYSAEGSEDSSATITFREGYLR